MAPTESDGPAFSTPSLAVRALFAMKAAAANPALLPELVKKFFNRVWTADVHAQRVDEYSRFSITPTSAIAAMTLATESEVEAVLGERQLSEAKAEFLRRADERNVGRYTWGGFGEVCYAICRLNKPKTVLETGVAFGWTSAFILAALEANGAGHLYSVDLPAFRPKANEIIGVIVPDRLRHRWTLTLGPQSHVLPRVLGDLGTVDFFHYDSDKTYQGMKWGYDSVWPRMAAGGVVMSDDVDNDAFLEFSMEQRQKLVVVVKPPNYRVAMIRRS